MKGALIWILALGLCVAMIVSVINRREIRRLRERLEKKCGGKQDGG